MLNWLLWGALVGAASIVAGAFGAHGLASRLDPRGLELWETASRYAMYGALATMQVGLFTRGSAGRAADVAGLCLLAGTAIFSGTLFAMALGAPRWLGAITPIGGALMIAGFLAFAYSAWR